MGRRHFSRGAQGIALREQNAADRFFSFVESQGFTRKEAEHIFQIYMKHRVLKLDVVGGQFTVKHGAFLDKSTLQNALAEPLTRRR